MFQLSPRILTLRALPGTLLGSFATPLGATIRTRYTFLFTFMAVGAAVLLKLGLQAFAGFDTPLLLFYSGVLFSAWYGGALQGFLATGLSLLACDYFFLPHDNLLSPPGPALPRLILFTLEASFITLLCAALRRSSEKAKKSSLEAQQALKTLQLSDQRFRGVLESDMIGVIFSQPDGIILETNNYFLKLIGYTRDDVQKGLLNWRSLTPPEFHVKSAETFRQLQSEGSFPPFEKEYLRRDGSRVPVMLSAAMLADNLAVTVILDISEFKKVQQRNAEMRKTTEVLQQSERFLDSVIENLPAMLFVKDASDLRFVRFNKAGEKLIGYPREQILGKNDFDILPREEAELLHAQDRAILESRKVSELVEEPISTAKGLRYLHTKKIPILDDDGKPLYLLGISEDITDRKEAEKQRVGLIQERLARAEAEKTAEQLRFLSQASGALTESLNLKSTMENFARIVIDNIADWCEVILVSEEDLEIEEVVIAHHDPEKAAWAVKHRKSTFQKSAGDNCVSRVIRTGKSEMYAYIDDQVINSKVSEPSRREALRMWNMRSAIVVPLQYYGRVLGALSIISSTENRRYTDLDLSLVHDLARRVSFAIENSRLFSKAQEASRTKSSFLANMSHEVRTPLGAMLGFAELLADGDLKPEQKKHVETLLRNGQQLMHIVDEILDLSKVESDTILIENVEFSPARLMDEVMSLLRPQAEEKQISFYINPLEELPPKIIADPTRLRQILLNVIGNAIKFTHSGSVDVHVELNEDGGDLNLLEISVSDSGIGITQGQREKLFQPFVQADNSMTRRFGGTGLGLFLSRRLARLMGGDVVLGSSPPLRGSQFIISVNVRMVLGEQQRALSAAGKKPANQTNRVLVVDDAADNRMLIQLYLSRLGVAADTAPTGQAAVDLALQHPYELILMDVQMPEMDGFEAVHALRANNYYGPVVALTAHTMKGDRERCLEGGFDDYLGKPIDREALKFILGKFLDHYSPSTGAPSPSSVH